jgi:hypothetical protein
MTATYEQIEDEAHRRFDENPCTPLAHYIIEVVREGWTPPEPVDPDVLAYREWELSKLGMLCYREEVLAGDWDHFATAIAFLAGARMAREQEQERAKVLVEFAKSRTPLTDAADVALAKYWGEAR